MSYNCKQIILIYQELAPPNASNFMAIQTAFKQARQGPVNTDVHAFYTQTIPFTWCVSEEGIT